MVGSDKHFPYLGSLGLFSGQGVNQDEPKVDPLDKVQRYLSLMSVYVILRRCRYKVIS